MIALFLLWIVICLSGRLLCKIGGEKEASQWWIHLTGFFFLFLSQGIIFFSGQMLQKGFLECVKILEFTYLLVSLLALVVCGRDIVRDIRKLGEKKEKEIYARHFYLSMALLLGLLWGILTGWQLHRPDAMVETVGITLLTDTMNGYHPFTHRPLELGIIFTRRFITLPFWYGALSHWTGLPAAVTVTIAGNIISFIFALFAATELGNLLFEGKKHSVYWLVIFMELFYLSGDYHPQSEGYSILHYGYLGETMIMAIVIPVMITLLYRLFGKYLRHNFDSEAYGISLWAAVIKMILIFGASLFLANWKWGILMLLVSLGIFGVMTLLIIGMKDLKNKREAVK